MKKQLQISYSAASKLQECGHKYKLHYIDRIRSRWYKSAFMFGNAIDDALNVMLFNHGEPNALDLALDCFDDRMSMQKINREEQEMVTYHWLLYSDKDLDKALLDADELVELQEIADDLNIKQQPLDFLDQILEKLKNHKKKGLPKQEALKKLTITERKFFNACNWCSCRHRGYIILETYFEQVMPKIKKVHGVQKKIELKSQEGHRLIGYIDIILEFKNREGLWIVDNKTTAMPYKEDAARNSTQMATYCYFEEIDQAMYITVSKYIKKNSTRKCKKCGFEPDETDRTRKCSNMIMKEVEGKEPKEVRCGGEYEYTYFFTADVNFIAGTIPYETQQMVMESYDQALIDLKDERFVKNLQGCETKFGKCEYYKKCWEHKTDKEVDLIKCEPYKPDSDNG